MADENTLQTFRFCPVQAVLDTLNLISAANPDIDFSEVHKVHAERPRIRHDHGTAQEMLRAVGRTVAPALYGKILEHVFASGSAAAGAAEPLLSRGELSSIGLTFEDLGITFQDRHVHYPLRPLTEFDKQNLVAIDKYLEAREAIAELEGHGSASRRVGAWRDSLKTLRAGRR